MAAVFKLLKVLKTARLFPGVLAQNYLVYLIYLLNKEETGSPVFEAAADYAVELVTELKSDFQFLKAWKRKVLTDKYYKEQRLRAFVAKTGDKQAVYGLFIDKLE